MRIERKKFANIITLAIASFGLLIFLIASVYALFSEMSIYEKFIFLFIFIVFSAVLYGIRIPLTKILSSNPEFELLENELLIFDNPYFDKIPYNEMLECDIYYPPRTTLLGITLKSTSEIESNSYRFQRLLLNVPEKRSKIVFLSLEFAKINPDDLKNLLKKRIHEK